jgi:hypothetical protein
LLFFAGWIFFIRPAFFFVSYLIATYIDGVPYAIHPNVKDNKFELIKILKDSQISKAFCSPNKTGAVNILKWINENDESLSSKGLQVCPEARFFR